MEPDQLKPGEKIAAPAQFEADRARAAEREETLGELRGYLEGEQRKALEADPYGHFKMRVPVGILRELGPQERERVEAFERQAFDRLRPIAKEKADQKRMFVAAGGDPDNFEADWILEREDAHIAKTAASNLERARRASSVYD